MSLAARAAALVTASAVSFACAARTAETAAHPTESAGAAELKVVSSGGFAAALRDLAPAFERSSGNKLAIADGPSMGSTPNAIPARLRRGEPLDVVIMVASALDAQVQAGKIVPGSRVDLARSKIGVVVRKGAHRPDISSAEALTRTLLDAASIAYSDSASGVYVSTELFQRLGIAEQVKAKSRMIPAEPVARVVARGEAEIGFQQISELLPVPGVDLVGPLPAELQKITVFSAGVVTRSRAPDAATALIRFLASPTAAPAIARSGLEPISVAGQDRPSRIDLDPDAVMHTVQRTYRAALGRGYKAFLKEDASAHGKVTLAFTVNQTGRTVNGAAHGFSAEVDAWIGGSMTRWTVPGPRGDKHGVPTDASFSITLQRVPD
jgi:molybdate transport system substrate-binding protein